MGTNIYNGYRLRVEPADGGIFAFIPELYKRWEEVGRELWLDEIAEIAARINDGSLPEGDPGGVDAPVFSRALTYECSKQTKAGERDRLSASICVLADPGTIVADPSLLYATLYCTETAFREAFEALPGVMAWPYWDSSDGPDGLSMAEWGHRKEVWDRVIGCDAPAQRGLVFELGRTRFRFAGFRAVWRDAAVLEAHIPSAERRALWLGYKAADRERVERNRELLELGQYWQILRESKDRAVELVPLFIGGLVPLNAAMLLGREPVPSAGGGDGV